MSKRKRNGQVRDRFLRRRIEGGYRDLLVFYAPEAIDARRGDVVDMPGADGVRVLFEGQESQMTTAGALWLVRAWAKDGAMVAARIELSAARLAVRDVKRALEACPDCDGTGGIHFSVTCPRCNGTGVGAE